jgi:hypothetical protein
MMRVSLDHAGERAQLEVVVLAGGVDGAGQRLLGHPRGVDGSMLAVEAAGEHPPIDRGIVQPNRLKLCARGLPLLPSRHLGDFFRFPKVISHTP